MRLILAPMEGVIDHNMRQLLTAIGGYDRCVTEFIRVTNSVVPAKVFRRLCPEIDSGGKTPSGVPVYVQLLGNDPERMARSAVVAVKNGAPGIDINFGCPAKLVNRHGGGSALLKEPLLVGQIVERIRQYVDPAIPVCAKIRLGFDDASLLPEIVAAIDQAEATELCIHARTRMDGYKPPAYWSHIGALDKPDNLTLIVNGEIWNAADAANARMQSGCDDVMLGRGSLACPDLPLIIRSACSTDVAHLPMQWQHVVNLVQAFFEWQERNYPRYTGNRTKQWLAYLKKHYVGAEVLFQQVKRLTDSSGIAHAIESHQNDMEQNTDVRQVCNQVVNRLSPTLSMEAAA